MYMYIKVQKKIILKQILKQFKQWDLFFSLTVSDSQQTAGADTRVCCQWETGDDIWHICQTIQQNHQLSHWVSPTFTHVINPPPLSYICQGLTGINKTPSSKDIYIWIQS